MLKYLLAALILFSGCSKSTMPSSSINGNPSGNTPGGNTAGADSLLYSFVTVGCNRVDKSDVSPSNPSTANLSQLTRTFKDILTLTPTPKYLFFTGDMVMGYTNGDTAALSAQLQAWVNLYETSGLRQAGTALVPVPGNHETLLAKGMPASAAAEAIWISVMQPYIRNNNGPGVGGTDGLTVDESRLTYSFDDGNTHFVVLNTDGVGRESRIPYRWVVNDISKAAAGGARHIFAFSHIPAFSFPGEDGLGGYPLERDTFWTAMEACHAELMLSAHNHVYYRVQPERTKTWQIIAGNGGSPLSSYITSSTQAFFGFTLVQVYQSGKVLVKSYGRTLPSGGYLADPSHIPTTLRDSLEVTWGK